MQVQVCSRVGKKKNPSNVFWLSEDNECNDALTSMGTEADPWRIVEGSIM